jgi:hypothetical protein
MDDYFLSVVRELWPDFKWRVGGDGVFFDLCGIGTLPDGKAYGLWFVIDAADDTLYMRLFNQTERGTVTARLGDHDSVAMAFRKLANG